MCAQGKDAVEGSWVPVYLRLPNLKGAVETPLGDVVAANQSTEEQQQKLDAQDASAWRHWCTNCGGQRVGCG